MVQTELIRLLNQTSSAMLDHLGHSLLVHDALLPSLRPPTPALLIRLPSSEREWIDSETCRRVDGYATVGCLYAVTWTTSRVRPTCCRTFPTQLTKRTYWRRRSTCWSSHTPTLATQVASTLSRFQSLRGTSSIRRSRVQDWNRVDWCYVPPDRRFEGIQNEAGRRTRNARKFAIRG